jgi:hypothetical protein
VALVVEPLPHVFKFRSSNPSTDKRKKRKRVKEKYFLLFLSKTELRKNWRETNSQEHNIA